MKVLLDQLYRDWPQYRLFCGSVFMYRHGSVQDIQFCIGSFAHVKTVLAMYSQFWPCIDSYDHVKPVLSIYRHLLPCMYSHFLSCTYSQFWP